jgi:hypothetical protein
MRRYAVIITTLVVLLLKELGPLRGEPLEAEAERFKQLLEGFKQQRDRLATGSFNAAGKIVTESDARGRRETKIDLYHAFDFKKHLSRFDYFESTSEGEEPKQRGGRLIITPDGRMFQNVNNPKKVHIHSPSSNYPPEVRPFDVRVLGISDESMQKPFEEAHDSLQNVLTLEAIAEASPAVYRITLLAGKPIPLLRRTI